MPQRTLLILAGYPASGKSTLLKSCAKGGLPLFGNAYRENFVQAVSKGARAEWVPTEMKLTNGIWLTLRDVKAASELDELPANVAFHLDLLLTVLARKGREIGENMSQEAIEDALEAFLTSDFCRKFDTKAVNTLDPGFDFIVRQWRERQATDTRRPSEAMASKGWWLTDSKASRETYVRVRDAWLDAAKRYCETSMLSRLDSESRWVLSAD